MDRPVVIKVGAAMSSLSTSTTLARAVYLHELSVTAGTVDVAMAVNIGERSVAGKGASVFGLV